MSGIIVLGSINMDLVASTNRAPDGGETVAGSDFQIIPGGKGANQAVAIARQDCDVVMIARVGKDGFGKELISSLAENNIQVERVKQDETCSTGVALIIVEESGENRIVVIPGANGQVTKMDVDESIDLFIQNDYLVMQLETPIDTVSHALDRAKDNNVKTILNAAPAPSHPLDIAFMRKVDYLLVNETEATAISGKSILGTDSAIEVAKLLQSISNGVVILTLGNQGAIASDGKSTWLTPAFEVDVIDTTAAGDSFTGGLVASLHEGKDLKTAIIRANASGAMAASKFGAQPSLPTSEEVNRFLMVNHL